MKKLKLFFGRFIRNITNEVINARIEEILVAGTHRDKEILVAGTHRDKEILVAIRELDILGGLMSRKEFVNKLKHTIKLIELRKKWIDASVYKKKGMLEAEMLIDLEKEIMRLYNKAEREDDKKEIARAEGRLEVMEWLKNVEEAK